MWKRILVLAVAVGLVGWVLLYCAAHGQAGRRARLIGAQNVLRQAYDEYQKTGTLPTHNGTWLIVPYTNQVMLAGRRIQLAVATTPWEDWSGEIFAVTPMGEIVWLSSTNGTAVLVSDPQYSVPLWKDGY